MSLPRAHHLAVLNSHPIQYFAPLYAYLSRDPSLHVTALYCSDFSMRGAVDPGFGQVVAWDIDLLAGYSSTFLGERAKRRVPRGFWSLICPDVWQAIRGGGFDAVVLHGYNYAVNLIAFMAAKSRGVPVLMRSETHLGLSRRGWRRRVRDSMLALAYRFVDGFLAIGTANRAYYRALGVPEAKIFDVPYTVDNDRFVAAAAIASRSRDDIRQRHGLPLHTPVVLYASKFTRRKHPDALIRAIGRLNDDGCAATLFMVGTGEMRDELKALAHANAANSVVFGGFVNQSELPSVYAASDIFVLPSENEPWGLIVNEVMCAGLPVIVSSTAGCATDLVQDGINGFRVPPGDVDALATALRALLVDDERRRRMGAASLSIIERWSYERCRRGITQALEMRAVSSG